MIHVWRTIDNLWKSVLSFHHVGSGELQVIRLGNRHLCQLSHPNSSEVVSWLL